MKKGKYIDWNILKRSMDHELSEEEKNTFENWYASHESHRNYYERMISEWNRETLRERNLSRILSKYDSLLQTRERCHLQVIRRRILYWSVAAVLFIGFGVAWIIEGFQSKVISPIPFTAIVPGQSKAYLSLYDGTNICLDETMDSLNIKVGTTEIRNRQGTVTFVMNDEFSGETAYNTLVVPRNGEYHIVLNDGTEVWLNADSYLKFPVYFKGKERRVVLTGEAYFKVAHHDQYPFIVETDLGNVRVYGTEFNVKRYEEEHNIRTTLVNGSVGFCLREDKPENYVIIEPGHQISYQVGEKIVVKKVNISNEIAWRNQLFCFESCTLEEIMKDIARWYDVSISFESEHLKKLYFTCTLDRYGNIEQLLRFFKEVYDIEFKIEGKQITVVEK